MLKLGIAASQTSVAKYMIKNRKPPSQTWCTFRANHVKDIIATDIFTVRTVTFRVLHVLVALSHDWREILHTNVTETPKAKWPPCQIIEAVGLERAPKNMVRDQARKFSESFS